MSEPEPPSDTVLQEPIKERDDAAYQTFANEAARRVWTVLQNLIEVRSRKTKGQMEGLGVEALFMGAATGVAMIAARMDIAGGDERTPPEVALLNDMGNQFLHTIEQMRAQDPIAKTLYDTRAVAEGVVPS